MERVCPDTFNNLVSSDAITHNLLEDIQILLHIQSIVRSKLNWTALPINERYRMLESQIRLVAKFNNISSVLSDTLEDVVEREAY